MSWLHRNRKNKSGERIDFKFSNFQLIQAPKGWDKLFVSIISVETGKTISKSSKALVRNGSCQWTETLSESIWISQEDTSKEMEENLFKFVVSMGSARSGILGEATVNMTGYMNSRASAAVLLPLKKCNHGTILQVKIQCSTPRSKPRNEEFKKKNSHVENLNEDCNDMDIKSDGSARTSSRSIGSSSSKDMGSASHLGEPESKETSFSALGSRHSSDSLEGSVGRENFSPRNLLNSDGYNPNGRQDSPSSQKSAPHGSYSVDDPSRSNNSSFNSRINGSGNLSQNHHQESGKTSSRAIATSSLKNPGSSKNLLETAEDTIEELRAEAKMWERNARKLMLDLDILRKECSDQSKNQANLEMELSAAYTECDGLKKEVEQLKLMLEESILKQATTDVTTFQANVTQIQKELEDEIKFQKESNDDLALQLKRSQESNIELVSVLQELEETIEEQKVEIDNFSALQLKLSETENSIQGKLEENRGLALQLEQLQESEKNLQINVRLLEQTLEDKSHELEIEQSLNSRILHDIQDRETEYKCKLSAKEAEITSLEAKLSESLDERHQDEMGLENEGNPNLIGEIAALKEKVQELEMDCNELTDENLELLFKLKGLKNNTTGRETSCDFLSTERPAKSFASSESDVSKVKPTLYHLEEELKKKINGEDQPAAFETSQLFSELIKQLQMAFSLVKRPWHNISSHGCEYDRDNLGELNSTCMIAEKGQAEAVLIYLVELNKLLEAKIMECVVLKHDEIEIRKSNKHVMEVQDGMEDFLLKENKFSLLIQKLESLKMELEIKVEDLSKELTEKIEEIVKLESNLLLKEEEIVVLRQCESKLEAQVSDLQKENVQLKREMDILVKESNITSKCLDDLQKELMVLGNSVDSHVSANKILERKSSELESGKGDVELHLFEVEQENIQLSERISGLEAQLRYLTDEKESSRLEIENSRVFTMNLQDEIARLGIEMETQKVNLKQKLQDMQNRWSEAQDECEYLKRANPKLQATAESLMEECSSLQQSNGELRKQKSNLHEHCMHLEAELRESRKRFADCSERVEGLEENFSSMLEEFASREKILTLELDVLLQDNRKHKEKLILEETLLNQMYLDKTDEVEKLQREVDHLTQQIYATHDERERIASNAVHEVSSLREDNAKLECALQEVQSKVKWTENALKTIQTESEMKVQSLMDELAAAKQSREMLLADHERMLKSFENYKSSGEKFNTTVNDLELKLTFSEYERQQLVEETASLKAQLQKIACLQDEVVDLKKELNAAKYEKVKLEASLKSISGDCEELKAEKISYIEKISILQKALSEVEECKRGRVALEEKILRMEGDLHAKEALCSQDAELKNELSRIKRTNTQFQRKIQQLDEEKDEWLKRAQAFEEELNLLKEENPGKGDNAVDSFNKGAYVGVDLLSKIQLLENELAEAWEANSMYKVQLKRVLSEGRQADAGRKSMAEGEVVAKERYERTKSSLETELRDLQDRYFNMSLKFAEVEAQREELVMKLKTSKSGKRWF